MTLGETDGMIAVYNHFDYLIGDKEKGMPKDYEDRRAQSESLKHQS